MASLFGSSVPALPFPAGAAAASAAPGPGAELRVAAGSKPAKSAKKKSSQAKSGRATTKSSGSRTSVRATPKTAKSAPGSARITGKTINRKSKSPAGTRSRRVVRRKSAPAVTFDPLRPSTLRAEAAVVMDERTGRIVWAKNQNEPRPIASLTKLMTALVFVDLPVVLGDSITVTMADVTGAGHSHVRAGNRVARIDLLRCSLISSDNAATRALARSTGLSTEEYVRRMNEKSRDLGLKQTRYVEVTGLDPSNVSSAMDQALVIRHAWDEPLIAGIMQMEAYTFRCGRRIEMLRNTNRLLHNRDDVAGGKTGFNRPAGYCLATQIGKASDPELTTVVLGAPSNSSRFTESAKLIDWAKRVRGPVAFESTPAHR